MHKVRQVVLGALVFAATLAILSGLGAVARNSGIGGSAAPSSSGRPAAVASASASARASASAGAASPSASSSASTASDPVLIGAGDIARCDSGADTDTAALLARQTGTVFTAGDNAYPQGTAAQFTDCYAPTWGKELARTRPTAGNHDHDTADLAGYLGYFGGAAAPQGTSWYSYDLGTWHVIALDATCDAVGGCGPDSAQGRWLAADLAASTATCTLAIWHQPRFSSGLHGNDTQVAPFWDALYAAGADAVVNGHDHDYERFAPQDPNANADAARGIREFVVGTGGAELRDFGTQQANSELEVSGYYGVIRLILHPGWYEWAFRTTAGSDLDAGSADCH